MKFNKFKLLLILFSVFSSSINAFSDSEPSVFIQKLNLSDKPVYSCLIISSESFELEKYCTIHSASASGEKDQKKGLFVILYKVDNLVFKPNSLYWTMHYSVDSVLTSTRVRKLKEDDLRAGVNSELISEDIRRLENTVLQNESLLEDLKGQFNQTFIQQSKFKQVVEKLKQYTHTKSDKQLEEVEIERKKSLLSCKDLKNDSGALNVRQELTTELRHLLGE